MTQHLKFSSSGGTNQCACDVQMKSKIGDSTSIVTLMDYLADLQDVVQCKDKKELCFNDAILSVTSFLLKTYMSMVITGIEVEQFKPLRTIQVWI